MSRAETDTTASETFGCPCCPEFETYSENLLHDHFGSSDCPFWEKVFSGEVVLA